MGPDWSRIDPPDENGSVLSGGSFKPGTGPETETETMQERIARVQADERDLLRFYDVEIARPHRMRPYYVQELVNLEKKAAFDEYDQEDRVDYLLLRNYLRRAVRRLDLESLRIARMEPLMPFAPDMIQVLEARQGVNLADLDPKALGQKMHDMAKQANRTKERVAQGQMKVNKSTALRAANIVEKLRKNLEELVAFFAGYHPLFDWWVSAPHAELDKTLKEFVPAIKAKLVGISPGSPGENEIVGEPIGREGLIVELEAEMIPYTPEQLITAAEERYAACVQEMKRAALDLHFGIDWRAALEHVKNLYVEPGEQARLVKELVDEGADYVKKRKLVTVPRLAEQTWRMSMMTPEMQRVNPFFLGGPSILVSYPTASMSHEDKLMGMRGNNRHFSRATAFHEMIPGHRLQLFVGERSRPYRRLFTTPFFVEGWATYWELVLWNRGDFFTAAEDRVGTLFWRMHRCARIIFSLRFHLGEVTPRQCVDLLVDMVGHERATAEGEVRRSLDAAAEYGPLYQAGYLLGALQLDALRDEVRLVGGQAFPTERDFHDRVLAANTMPIELLRALLLGQELSRDYKARWKFLG